LCYTPFRISCILCVGIVWRVSWRNKGAVCGRVRQFFYLRTRITLIVWSVYRPENSRKPEWHFWIIIITIRTSRPSISYLLLTLRGAGRGVSRRRRFSAEIDTHGTRLATTTFTRSHIYNPTTVFYYYFPLLRGHAAPGRDEITYGDLLEPIQWPFLFGSPSF